MRNYVPQFTNDIYLLKINQHILSHEPSVSYKGYANPERRENAEGAHAYVVEWQISEDEKKVNDVAF